MAPKIYIEGLEPLESRKRSSSQGTRHHYFPNVEEKMIRPVEKVDTITGICQEIEDSYLWFSAFIRRVCLLMENAGRQNSWHKLRCLAAKKPSEWVASYQWQEKDMYLICEHKQKAKLPLRPIIRGLFPCSRLPAARSSGGPGSIAIPVTVARHDRKEGGRWCEWSAQEKKNRWFGESAVRKARMSMDKKGEEKSHWMPGRACLGTQPS